MSLKICRKFRPVERVDDEIVRRYSAFIAVGESDAREDRKSQNNCCASQDHRVIRSSARPAVMDAGHGDLASHTLKTPGETVSSTKLNERLLNFRMRRRPSR